MTSLVVAARRELASYPEVTSLLGSSAQFTTFIFRWRSFIELEGTGAAEVVLSERAGWTSPNNHNTARFPRLQVEVFVDAVRVPVASGVTSLQPAEAHVTPEDRASEIFEEIDKVFHRPQGGELWWDDLRVVSSLRYQEPDTVQVPGGDGKVRLLTSYAVTLG